ncbi:CES5A, partial [Cordylochernes scorpioides]
MEKRGNHHELLVMRNFTRNPRSTANRQWEVTGCLPLHPLRPASHRRAEVQGSRANHQPSSTYQRDPIPSNMLPEKVQVQKITPIRTMSEDCLYLNIWTPSQMSNISVLIYIYGGSFLVGSTDEMFNNPQYLAAKTEMVVVTMNYRVGSLGFLDLNMEGAYGNLGLSDQILAFKWVKNNIRAFGGNPDSVTLYGLSAGSMSIAFHLSIKENENLFQRAFLQSGTSNSGPNTKLKMNQHDTLVLLMEKINP